MRLEDIVVVIDGKKIAVSLSEEDGWYEFTPVDPNDEEACVAASNACDTYYAYRDAQVDSDGMGGYAYVDPWDRLVEWLRDQFGNDCVTYRKVVEEGDEGKVY